MFLLIRWQLFCHYYPKNPNLQLYLLLYSHLHKFL
ncbi:hypothetical protein BMETH_1696_0 [methanotrophic bacterial endosymbiont of Bathymodiolus sp.]|nr:hypothetical protein BMETH_1696_0 [methanotrophic bacterial endosymbiont of Bathymodiolus sp.]